jgi:hypothetical protein
MGRLQITLVLLASGCSGAASTVNRADGPPAVETGTEASTDVRDADGQDAGMGGIDAPICLPMDAATIPEVGPSVASLEYCGDAGTDGGGAYGLCTSSVPDPLAAARSPVCGGAFWCGAGSCGNGVRDTCAVCVNRCVPAVSFTEPCDGVDLGGNSCASLGYEGGTLRCGTDCNFDVSKCVICAPSGPMLLSCSATPLAPPGEVAVLSLATSGDQTAIAWTLANEGGVYIALYGQDLRLVANLGPIGHARGGWSVPIAATPNGWVVAIPSSFFEPGADVITLSSCGVVTGTFALPGAVDLAFAAEPGKPPLVAWIDSASGSPMVRAGRLAADGRSVPSTVALFSGEFYDDGPLSATFVGDGFLVAGVTLGVTVARVEADGTFAGIVQTPFGPHTDEPRITSDGMRAEIAYFDSGGLTGTTSLASLDRTGVPVGARLSLEETMRVIGLAVDSNGRAVALASDRGVVLEALPLRADGTLDTPVLIAGDHQGVGGGALARRASELVAAWIGGGCEGRPHLARLAP